jgi:O-antigen/teichoic acid export membrane protein
LGALGGLVVAMLAPWLVESVLEIPLALRAESVTAFRMLALAIPFTVSTAGFRGILEAVQAFGRINALRIPFAFITFVGPLLVLPFSRALPATIGVLAVGRIVLWIAHVHAMRTAYAPLRRTLPPERRHLRPLLAAGGWMTVSNLVSPLMYSLDRFAVAAVLSVTAVSYYVTAYEAVTRLWLVTSVLLPVLFPALALALQRDRLHAVTLLDRAGRAAIGAVFPAALALSAFAPEWLSLWLGADFGVHAAVLAQGLTAAVFVNVAGQLAYTVLQAGGRADITGRLHLLELVPYLGALWALLHGAGTVGVVVAWGGRVVIDTAALLVAAGRVLPEGRALLRRTASWAAIGAPVLLVPRGSVRHGRARSTPARCWPLSRRTLRGGWSPGRARPPRGCAAAAPRRSWRDAGGRSSLRRRIPDQLLPDAEEKRCLIAVAAPVGAPRTQAPRCRPSQPTRAPSFASSPPSA